MFETFRESQRWARAKSDTKGFVEWRRNTAIALVAVIVEYWASAWLGAAAAMNDVGAALITFVVIFALLPIMELGWNYLRAPRRIAEANNLGLQDELAGLRDRIAQHLMQKVTETILVGDRKTMGVRGERINIRVIEIIDPFPHPEEALIAAMFGPTRHIGVRLLVDSTCTLQRTHRWVKLNEADDSEFTLPESPGGHVGLISFSIENPFFLMVYVELIDTLRHQITLTVVAMRG